MRRFIEIVSALAATTLGLIGVLTEVRALADGYGNVQIASVLAAFSASSWYAISDQISHFLFLLAILLVSLSIGAYLHAFYRSVWGLAILWISTFSLTALVGFATLTPPTFGFRGGSLSASTLDVVPTAIPVLTIVLAVVAAVAAITPVQRDSLPVSVTWLKRFGQIIHPHSSE